MQTFSGHAEAVTAVALSSDGRCAISASEDNTLKVWEIATGCEVRTLAGHTDSVNRVALTRDGRIAVSASSDQTLKGYFPNRFSAVHFCSRTPQGTDPQNPLTGIPDVLR